MHREIHTMLGSNRSNMRGHLAGTVIPQYWIGFALAALLLFIWRYSLESWEDSPKATYSYNIPGDDYADFPEWPGDKLSAPSLSTTTTSIIATKSENDASRDDLLVKMAADAMEDGVVTLVYASYSYKEPLFNWLVALRKAKRGMVTSGVLLICLDDGLVDLIRAAGWDCFKEAVTKNIEATESGSLNKDTVKTLWVARVNHVQRILQAGINTILSDTDAIWLRDPRKALTEDTGDVIASRANFPYDSPWGATLCMGFIFFRASPQVSEMSKSALEQTILAQDDQIGFNRALFDLPFEDRSGKKLAFGRKITPNGNNVAKAAFYLSPSTKDRPLRLTLLAHSSVARYCADVSEDDWNTVLIAHCHVNEGKPAPTQKHKGNQATHTAILEKYHLYFLKKDWDSTVNDYVDGRAGRTDLDPVGFDALVASLASSPKTDAPDDR